MEEGCIRWRPRRDLPAAAQPVAFPPPGQQPAASGCAEVATVPTFAAARLPACAPSILILHLLVRVAHSPHL